jgi:hypothetical protein
MFRGTIEIAAPRGATACKATACTGRRAVSGACRTPSARLTSRLLTEAVDLDDEEAAQVFEGLVERFIGDEDLALEYVEWPKSGLATIRCRKSL